MNDFDIRDSNTPFSVLVKYSGIYLKDPALEIADKNRKCCYEIYINNF